MDAFSLIPKCAHCSPHHRLWKQTKFYLIIWIRLTQNFHLGQSFRWNSVSGLCFLILSQHPDTFLKEVEFLCSCYWWGILTSKQLQCCHRGPGLSILIFVMIFFLRLHIQLAMDKCLWQEIQLKYFWNFEILFFNLFFLTRDIFWQLYSSKIFWKILPSRIHSSYIDLESI